jgi:alpha-1,2-mannosyltransferase
VTEKKIKNDALAFQSPFSHSWFGSKGGVAVGYVLCAVVLFCYVFFQVLPLAGDGGPRVDIPGIVSHQNDYKHVYLGSVLLNAGLSPYEVGDPEVPGNMRSVAGEYYGRGDDPRFYTILPYVYLPFTGSVMTPFTWLPFPKSVIAFMMVNHLCILSAVVLALLALGWRGDPWSLALVLAVVTFSHPVFRQNNAGQLNGVLLFGFSLLFLAMSRKWHASIVGLIAAFLMLFKISPGIFLIYFLLRRQWGRAGWMVAWAGGLMLLMVGLYGFDRHLEFLPILKDMGFGKSTWGALGHTFWRDDYNLSLNSLFHRLFVQYPGWDMVPWVSLSSKIANALTWAVALGLLSLFGYTIWKARGKGRDEAPAFAVAVCASLLLPSIMWDHYLVQFYLPAMIMFFVLKSLGWRSVVLLMVVVASLPLHINDAFYHSGMGLLLGHVKLLSVLTIFVIGCYYCIYTGSQNPELSDPSDGSDESDKEDFKH